MMHFDEKLFNETSSKALKKILMRFILNFLKVFKMYIEMYYFANNLFKKNVDDCDVIAFTVSLNIFLYDKICLCLKSI